MSKKYLERAAADGRLAACPEWLQTGRKVFYWRECLCRDDLCPESVTAACPINRGAGELDPIARGCARKHPVLEAADVWSVAVYFTAHGPEWSINDMPAVPDRLVRKIFFATAAEARKARPREVL